MKGHRWETGDVSRIVGALDEVENLMEAGEALVVFSRHHRIETLKGTEVVNERRKKRLAVEEAHEGRTQVQRWCVLASERGRSGEHRPCSWLKTRHRVRTLGRSKALKPGPTLVGSGAS